MPPMSYSVIDVGTRRDTRALIIGSDGKLVVPHKKDTPALRFSSDRLGRAHTMRTGRSTPGSPSARPLPPQT